MPCRCSSPASRTTTTLQSIGPQAPPAARPRGRPRGSTRALDGGRPAPRPPADDVIKYPTTHPATATRGECDGRPIPDRGDAADDGAARGDPRPRARARPARLRHDLARRGLSVVAQALDGGTLGDRDLRADRARD